MARERFGNELDIFTIGETSEVSNIENAVVGALRKGGWTIARFHWTGGGTISGFGISVKGGADEATMITAACLMDTLNAIGLATDAGRWNWGWTEYPRMINGLPFNEETAAPIRMVIGPKLR